MEVETRLCGIVGVVNLRPQPGTDRKIITQMTNSMFHRGPDETDVYIDERIALGHRRLRIIDLSPTGKQPMFNARGDIGIVFNGEIYNFAEIRETLVCKGYKFQSKTDTEVIINSYAEEGINCINKFIGMFAFALYDKSNSKVFIVRDRIGIKPIYYTVFNDKLIFASEIKAILAFPGFKREPNYIGISSYLSYRYPIGEHTLFQNIYSLLPGHYLEVEGDKIRLRQYWELPIVSSTEDKGEAYYVENIRKLLRSAVEYRMISDVPIGAYLSGGLDSSIIVALMAELSNEPVKTFTIGFEEEGYNEFGYANLVADMYKTEHHEILLSAENYLDNMVELIRYKDAPLGVANEPALYVMSKELKKYITVVLSGEGSDEIFGGYGRIFRSPFDFERLKNLKATELKDEPVLKLLKSNLQQKYGDQTFVYELDHFLFQYQYIKWKDKENLLSTDFIRWLDKDQPLNSIFASIFSKLEDLDLYQKYMWVFEKIHIVGLLHRVDATTMATAVEARVPFVDHRLIEFAMTIPIKYKLRWKTLLHKLAGSIYSSDQISEIYDEPKYILKKSFEVYLPKQVVWRKKMGFPVPVHRWLSSKFNNFAREILLDETARSRKIYNTSYIQKILSDAKLFDNHSLGLKIWMLVNLELWYRYYID